MTAEGVHARATSEPDWICAPVLNGLDAEILVAPGVACWTWSVRARLPEAGREQVGSAATREEAWVAALEDLVAWCGEQKATGGKRHQKQAGQLQEWALGREQLVRTSEGAIAQEIPAAPVADHAAQQLTVEWLPIGDVIESPWNPRLIFPEKEMGELVESMGAGGFRPWQPLVGRPVGPTSECWLPVASGERRLVELGAGHRRRRAAELAGLTMVPVVVREMSDEEFLKLLNFDNSGREDVHPLHEAAGWGMLMQRTGMGPKDIARHIGQSKEYVYQRLKYSSLIDSARQAFVDGQITPRHAILIARLSAKQQEKALAYSTREDWQGHKPTSRMLERWLKEEEYIDLRGCVFDVADRGLVSGAGSCEECPKRGKNIPGFEVDNPEADICADRACYTAKADAHLVQIRKRLEADGEKVVLVSEIHTNKKGVLRPYEYDIVEAGAKGAKQALIVAGGDAGKVVTVRVRAAQSGSSSSASGSEADRAKLQKQEEQRTAKIEQERSVRLAILRAIRPKVSGLSRTDIEALLVEVLHNFENADVLCELHGVKCDEKYGECEALEKALPKLKEVDLFQLCVEISLTEDLNRWNMDGRQEPKLLLAAAKRYKVDAVKIRREVEEAGKAAEGGTREEVGKPAKKKAPVKKATTPAKTNKLSADARKRIAAAQSKRAAAAKGGKK